MNYNKWKYINDKGYNSDVISFLQFIKNEEELDEEHTKTQSILQLLNRKQLINENGLTILGEELLKNIEIDEIIPIKAIKIDKFEEWWKIFPASDAFEMDNRTFMGTQSKRIKKDICKKTFNKLLNVFTAEDIIKSTSFIIEQAKKISLKKGTNQISFIANSERFLREEMFSPYIEMSKNVVKEVEYKSNIL